MQCNSYFSYATNPITDNLLGTLLQEVVKVVDSPLNIIRVQPRKDRAACHDFLNCNYSSSFEDFSVLYNGNKKDLKESLFII